MPMSSKDKCRVKEVEDKMAMVTNFIYGFIYWGLVISFVVIISFSCIYYYKKSKTKLKLNDFQNEIISEGKHIVKDNMLRNLYLSDNGSKQINVGKIQACVVIKEKELNYYIFAIKKGIFPNYKFYKVKFDDVEIKEGNKEIFGDVVLNKWNFKRDNSGIIFVYNEDSEISSEVVKDNNRIGVDTIARVSPLVSNAILINAVHRLRMREAKLIRLPSDDSGSVPQQ